ncbi:MAG TPA: hypothetical protein VK464_00180, partial [Symbiobacteriaceae bacterium]|nr:hypothetical protein [Symbiobacteriaceae bacterium]
MSQEHLHQEEELSPAHALSLREIFGEKFMEFGSMDRLIRWVTGLGIAQIIVAVLLIGLNMTALPSIAVHRPDGSVSFTLAWPILVTCVAFMVVAWTWLVVGALHSRLLLRVPVLGLFAAMHGLLLTLHGGSMAGWTLMALWLVYVIWHGVKRPAGFVRDAVVVGLGLAYFYMTLADQYNLINPSGEFVTTLISGQIMITSLLLMPLFVFAGLDLGESVRDVTRWLIGQGAARTGERTLLWMALGICAVKIAVMVGLKDGGVDWLVAAPFVVAAGYICVRMRPWEGLEHEPQVGLLLTGTLLLVVLMFGAALMQVLTGGEME